MNKTIGIVVGAVVLVALVIWWLWPRPLAPDSRLTLSDARPLSTPSRPFDTTGQQAISIPSTDELAKTPAEKRERYLEKAREVGKSYNRPANFYAQILDQNNQPVAGVKVVCDLTYFGDVVLPGLVPHNKRIERMSGNDGRFSFKGEAGLALDVKLSPKKGYEFKDGGFLQCMLRDEGIGKPAPVVSTPERPYVFRTYKKGQTDALLKGSIFNLCQQDGRFYVVDLKANRLAEGTSGGDLKISVRRPAGWTNQEDYDWSVQIESVNADVLESHDEFMYEAPVAGYVPVWSFAQHAGEQGYRREVNPRFYLKSRDGSTYGRLEMEFTSSYRDKFGVRMRYWLNPIGSRNLEPDGETEGAAR